MHGKCVTYLKTKKKLKWSTDVPANFVEPQTVAD